MISWPERFGRNATCDNLVSIMDVFPTLAEVAGIALPSELDGRSLAPLLEDGSTRKWRTSMVVSHHGNLYGLCTMRAVVGERYKAV